MLGKWTSYFLCGMVLLITSTECFSNTGVRYIYGINMAKTFASNSHGPFYISLGAFKNKSNANILYQSLHSTYSSRLHISFAPKTGTYNVLVGPLYSAKDVRAQGVNLSHTTKHSPKITQPIKTIQPSISPVGRLTYRVSTKEKTKIKKKYSPKVLTLSLGPSFNTAGQQQTFYLQPEIVKTFTTDHHKNVIGSGELFFGLQKPISNFLFGQLGAALAVSSQTTVKGDIWEDADRDFDNYTYQYMINHGHIALKGKLLTIPQRYYNLQSYVSASVGVGYNRSSDFSIKSKLFQEVPAPDFATQTKFSATYTVGIGVQRPLSQHFSSGIGYEFSDWGKSGLGRADGQTENSGLSLSHLYNHTLMFNITYTE